MPGRRARSEAPTATRATISDVAAEAGVSKTTVSQILNGKGRASEATRALVIEAAQRIGYGANPIARSLRTGRTGVLGIIFRPTDAISGSLHGTEFHIRVAGGAAASALGLGYGLLHVPDATRINDIRYPMDGCVVVAPYANDALLGELRRRGLPLVSVDPDPDHPDGNVWIGRDETAAMQHVLDHLAEQGMQSSVLVAITDDNAWKRGFESTYRTWCKSHRKTADVVEVQGVAGSEGARDAVAAMIAAGRLPDVIIGATSRFAVGAAAAVTAAGLSIPQDVMIAALSDSELARSHTPPITALDLHGDAVGKGAVQKLVEIVSGTADVGSTRIMPTLKIRESTLPADADERRHGARQRAATLAHTRPGKTRT
ncbi:LacI family DNA-binding transcriptional regulator [Chitinasiproducens palmae]|uniref:DNA-binding transcriptional regulator, LacI/PurR family n=1 Tax=Chitinasiproducens palmae TaxID=1770053 RepID=A0A1H2PW69_9BURK|nr:LacI family DNA-binding transcriptional regulator [Chitinasiproducens palmae]SDV51561.1 DNA-binding transcriptional regulator, LacI/PurR family [Chitinasiproducens palmae]